MEQLAITGTYTDLYQLSMAQVYFLAGEHENPAVFDYFYRKNPFEGGYVVFAGLETLLDILADLRFSDKDCDFLASGGFDKKFLEYLKSFRFRATVYSAAEGSVVFPGEPILIVHGSMLEAQLVETLVLNMLNFQSLIATKAARMRSVAGDRILCDFGLRRAQGLAGYHAARAAMIGGFDATSNVMAARDFGIPAVGTMAHSFVQVFEKEIDAFRRFADKRPDNCVLLVDTYDTLGSGVPNAITVAREMESRGHRLQGIRLDSGDLAYLSKRAREMLDNEGLHYVGITVSNQLDEYVIKSLLDQKAPIDVFGVGTSLVTAPPDAALDGVYKLSFGNGRARIKLSENLKKITLPGKKQVYRLLNGDNRFAGADVIMLADETDADTMFHPVDVEKSLGIRQLKKEPLLHKVMENGRCVVERKSISEISRHRKTQLELLPPEHTRFEYPHVYKIGISGRLKDLRNELKTSYRK